MRRKSLVFVFSLVCSVVLLLLLSSVAMADTSGWYQQASGTTTDTFRSMSAANSSVAWAVSNEGHLFKTIDGGVTWTQCSYPFLGPACVSAVDANTAWVGGWNYTISKTTDGGATWTQQYTVPPSIHYVTNVDGVCAVDANNVWACGYIWYQDTYPYGIHGVVMRTSDGGLNWASKYYGETNSQCWAISALNGNTAWVCGYNTTNNNAILKTTDGGTTWVQQATGISDCTVWDISAVDENHAFAVGNVTSTTHAYILKTTDGSNWTSTDMGMSQLMGTEAVDANTTWAVGTGGTILKTTDGGTTWAAQQSGVTADLSAIDAVNTNVAWAGGANGTILHTTTGGVIPTITAITPTSAYQGQTLNVNIVGQNTHFVNGPSATTFSGTGITVNSTTVTDATHATANITISPSTPTGPRDVNLTTGSETPTPLTGGFTVNAAAGLTVTSITPAASVENTIVNITNLAGTGFKTGATVRIEKTGTTVNATDVNVVSATKITCKLNLAGAPLGKYDVVVRNTDAQEARLTQGFSVTNICGGGAAISLSIFGIVMGMMSLAGSTGLRRRFWRRKK